MRVLSWWWYHRVQRRVLRCRSYVCGGCLALIVLILTANSRGAWSPLPYRDTTMYVPTRVEGLQIREISRQQGQTFPSVQLKLTDRLAPPTIPLNRTHVDNASVDMPHQTPQHTVQSDTHPPSLDTPPPLLDTHGIRIMPKSPVLVAEGHALQVTCVAIQLMHRKEQEAPYMTFELSPMSLAQERKLAMALRPGAVVLKFAHVSRKQEGTYRCVATDATGKRTYNLVTIKVIRRDGADVADEYDKVKAYPEGEDWLEELQAVNNVDVDGVGDHGNGVERVAISKKLQELKHRFQDNNNSSINIQELLDRGKLQQQGVADYCHKYNMSDIALQLPMDNASSASLYRHLLINDKTQTLFCFAPKTGCTNLRILFFLVLGYIPLSQVVESRDGVDQNRLEAAQFLESFYSRNKNQRLYALKHYFKFAMYRNPLERLVSGFRSKVERYPLVGLKENTPHFNWLRKAILLQTQPEQYSQFLHHRGKNPVNISFSDFIDYWLKQPVELKFDEHFRSISSLCQPCRTRYSFYANFKNFDVDSQLLVEKIKARPEFLRGGYYSRTGGVANTAELAPQLYSQLSRQQKLAVLSLLAQELDFYYHIFPQEINCHKIILGLDMPLPPMT